jgi:two-component system chemotaxis response regulator CheB
MYELVVIGCSGGGLEALSVVLGGLAAGFPACIVVVQHRHRTSSESMAALLQAGTALPVDEPLDKAPLRAGHVLVAPAGYHLLVDRGHACLSLEAPVRFSRPSIDVLFESAAHAYGRTAVGVVLTGANEDGAAGLRAIERCGGHCVVQDPQEASQPAMPRAAIEATTVHRILKVVEIAPYLGALCAAPR